jgi:hypothetical protein
MQIQPADIAERRRVTRILICVAVLLVALSVAFQFWLRHLTRELDGAALLTALKPVLRIFLLLIAACIAGLGAYLLARGRAITRERRFPASGTRVIRATPVLEGAPALRFGRRCQLGGAIVCVVGCIVAVFAILWVKSLG